MDSLATVRMSFPAIGLAFAADLSEDKRTCADWLVKETDFDMA